MYQVKLHPAGSRICTAFESIGAMAAVPRNDSNAAIGNRLRLIRLAYGALQDPLHPITQAEFSRLCGIGRAAWNNAETGDNRIGIDGAMAICRRTGVTLDYIYFGERSRLPHALALEIERLESQKPAARRA